MMRNGTCSATLAFAIIGLVFTVVAAIFAALNSFSTPIGNITGVNGLVAWNAIAALCYFLVICIFAGEFGANLKKDAPISQVIRYGVVEWKSDDMASLGYSYW